MGVIWENSFGVFLLLTVVLGGGAAWLTGRALAFKWRSYWQAVFFMLPLACAVRFFHYALFGETLLTLHYYLVDAAVLLISVSLGFRIMRATQMTSQYGWLYERRGPLSWRRRAPSESVSEQ